MPYAQHHNAMATYRERAGNADCHFAEIMRDDSAATKDFLALENIIHQSSFVFPSLVLLKD
eukprot:scaffold9680_cov47-Attheya_sp.AAC.2